VKEEKTGDIVEVHCTWDPASRGGRSPDGRKVKGTCHFVSAEQAVDAEVRLYDRLFTKENPLDNKNGSSFLDHLNPDSLTVVKGCKLEPSLADAAPGSIYQYERVGYFCADTRDSKKGALVFNRAVSLRDTWARIERSQQRTEGKQPKSPEKKEQSVSGQIFIDDFAKLDLRVAVIREAGLVEGADKLVRLAVDIGEGRLRQVFAGIRSAYPSPEILVGKKVIVVANLKPRKMKFGISEGMVLAGVGEDAQRLAVATFEGDLLPGDQVS
jgi:methionine--tRNA ligase beta chain